MSFFRLDARRAVLMRIAASILFGAGLASGLVDFYVQNRTIDYRPSAPDQRQGYTMPVAIKGATKFVSPTENEEITLLLGCFFGPVIVGATLILIANPARTPDHPIPEVRANLIDAQQSADAPYTKFAALGFVLGMAFLVFAGPGIARSLAEQHGAISP